MPPALTSSLACVGGRRTERARLSPWLGYSCRTGFLSLLLANYLCPKSAPILCGKPCRARGVNKNLCISPLGLSQKPVVDLRYTIFLSCQDQGKLPPEQSKTQSSTSSSARPPLRCVSFPSRTQPSPQTPYSMAFLFGGSAAPPTAKGKPGPPGSSQAASSKFLLLFVLFARPPLACLDPSRPPAASPVARQKSRKGCGGEGGWSGGQARAARTCQRRRGGRWRGGGTHRSRHLRLCMHRANARGQPRCDQGHQDAGS